MRRQLKAVAAAVARPGADRWLVPAFFVAFALVRAAQFEERDPYWEARAGIENLAGQPLARPDSWSWSGVDGLWYQNSPLWNTLLGLAYQWAGFWGLYLFTAATLGAYFAIALRLASRLGARRLPSLVGVAAAIAPALSMLSPRGTMIVQIVILGSILLFVEASERWCRGPGWLVGGGTLAISLALSVLGNWLHLSFLLFSPVLAGAWMLVAWFSGLPTSRRVLLISAGGLGWLGGPLLSPYGLTLGWERSRVVAQVCDGLILEWTTPFQSDISPVFWLMAICATAVAAICSALSFRGWRRAGRPVVRPGELVVLLIGVPCAVAGWFAIRFLGVSLLTLAPLAAVAVTIGVDKLRTGQRGRVATRWREYTTGGMWRVVVAGALVALSPWMLFTALRHAEPGEVSAIAELPSGCRLLSSGGLSASVILTRPDVPVWIDGRADFYGREHLIRTYSIFAAAEPGLVPEGTGCILLDLGSRDSRDLAPAVAASPQWRLVHDDGRYRIWLPVQA